MKKRKEIAYMGGPLNARFYPGYFAYIVLLNSHNSVRKLPVGPFLSFRSSKMG